MADPTNPQAGVEPAAATIEQRMQALLVRQEQGEETPPEETPPAAAPEAKPEPTEAKPQDTSELTPEDIPDEQATPAQPSGDAFEIVHNGQQHKLSREETIKLAQQGFDYTQKTQAIAERSKQLDAALQRASEIEQVMPVLAQEQAAAAAIKAQIDQYKEVNWVQLANEQPLEYPKYRAQYDLLVSNYNQSVNVLNQAANEVQRRRQEVTATVLQQEFQKLQEFIPEWKDPAKYKSGAEEVSNYLLAEGVPREELATLSNAIAVKIARKAMLYDKLLKSKGEKSKLLQTTPPVSRPGVPNTPQSAQADKTEQLAKRFKKTGSVEDATALYLQRLK